MVLNERKAKAPNKFYVQEKKRKEKAGATRMGMSVSDTRYAVANEGGKVNYAAKLSEYRPREIETFSDPLTLTKRLYMHTSFETTTTGATGDSFT